MNKQTFSIEFSFDVDAGTIELLDDDKLCTYRPIHPEVFFERYSNYKMDLKGKTYIDSTAQQVLKIAESVIKNVIEENDGCVRVTTTGYETDVDHVDVVDVVYTGYTLYFNKYGDICASCMSLIVADVFTTAHTTIHDIYLYKALDSAMSRALKDAGISDKISWFDFDF